MSNVLKFPQRTIDAQEATMKDMAEEAYRKKINGELNALLQYAISTPHAINQFKNVAKILKDLKKGKFTSHSIDMPSSGLKVRIEVTEV